MIDRIVYLGFEVRVEMTLANDSPLIAQLTRAQVEELELADGQIVYVTPSRAKVFIERRAAAHRGARPRVSLAGVVACVMLALRGRLPGADSLRNPAPAARRGAPGLGAGRALRPTAPTGAREA